MAFKFFTIPVRDDGSAEAELNAFLRGHRVLAVKRRWVDQGSNSFWSLCVDYLDGPHDASGGRSGTKRGKDYEGRILAGFERADRKMFDRKIRPCCECNRQAHISTIVSEHL